MGSTQFTDQIKTVAPLSYLETLAALREAQLVMTDSGGLQKEAFFCGRCCVVLRPETEWKEIVDCGAAMLADADPEKIAADADLLWDHTPCAPTQFGNGHAAETILENMAKTL